MKETKNSKKCLCYKFTAIRGNFRFINLKFEFTNDLIKSKDEIP